MHVDIIPSIRASLLTEEHPEEPEIKPPRVSCTYLRLDKVYSLPLERSLFVIRSINVN